MTTYPLLVAFLIGLFSTLHCLGMCGGIIGALTLSLPQTVRERRWQLFGYVLAYNFGRIASYVVAGAVVGALGATLLRAASPQWGHLLLQALAAAVLITMGLYLAGWFPRFSSLEIIGAPVWRRLEPLGRRLLPVRSPWHAVLFGTVWGWLPCGLVYSALLWSTTSGAVLPGALTMLAFGLGTLPGVAGAGMLAGWITRVRQIPRVRQAIGVSVIALGIGSLWLAALEPPGGDHAHHLQLERILPFGTDDAR